MINALEELITKNYPKLTKGQKRIAEYIVKNPEEVAFLSSKTLGKKVGVSDATVVRLSTALGISGFSELQEMLQSWLKGRLTPSQKLRSTKVRGRTSIYDTVFEINLKNISKAREEIPIAKLERAVNALDHGRRIFVMGLRRSHSFAFHLYNNLSRFLKNTFIIDPAYGLIYDQIKEVGHRDVFVSISFSRYTKETVEITRFAKARKAFVIAITDNLLSPVGQLADIVLCVDYGSPFFFGSHASTLVIIDCLIGGLSLKHKKKYVEALTQMEKTLRQCGVWVR
jgi:DNA-binding MurR/RpiR family transcriptional regulator